MNIEIGHLQFKTIKAGLDHFKEILNRYSLVKPRVNREDTEDLKALILRHPHAEQKIGCGIKCFTIESNKYGSRGFILHRSDGSSADFSYIHAVKGRPRTLYDEIRRCARAAIVDLARDYRDYQLQYTSRCMATGVPITSGTCNVDHFPTPFRDIVDDFLEADKIGWDDISKSRDNQLNPTFSDAVAQRFVEFHRGYGLRLVHQDVTH